MTEKLRLHVSPDIIGRQTLLFMAVTIHFAVRRAGSDGIMSASGSAGPGFNPRWGGKF